MEVPYPGAARDVVGWVTEEQMIEVDRVMIDDLHIELLQMMENAGRNLARVVLDTHGPTTVAVAAGTGGNGGGGLVAARHLANAGADVTVAVTSPDRLSPTARHQYDILGRMGVPTAAMPPKAEVTVDAVIGYSLRGAPRGRSAEFIESLTGRGAVVALDTPSGLDVTTGEAPGLVVDAAATVTLALPKVGLRSAPSVGTLLLADISVPRSVTEPLGGAPDFSRSPILHLE
ncbi:MAG: NAD(P)H-hydrate epimerase [Actinomycetota bacterium]